MYKVLLLKDAEDWLFKLPIDQRDELLILIHMLKELGYELQYPFTKHLTGTKEKIKELRCRRFGNRLYYMHHEEKIYVGLLGGNKGSQKQDIKKADKQAKKIRKGEVDL